jgi:hypothetical protein
MHHQSDPHLEFKGNAERPGIFWALAAGALAFAILGAIGLSNGGCHHLSNERDRLACYDAATQAQPAKGAAARATNGE